MIVAGSASPLLLSSAGGYNLTNSLRFRASASAYLNRTPASAGNRLLYTISLWVKRGTISGASTSYVIGNADASNNNGFGLAFTNDSLFAFDYTTAYQWQLITTQVFRDPSAWYHIVLAYDSAQATASNRVKIYVNGSQVTAFSTSSYPSSSYSSLWNNTSLASIGRTGLLNSNYFDGYLDEVNFIDGQALTPSSFGATSATTGVWQPIRYAGTYGTNGFFLPFTDNSALTTSSNVGLGRDYSGNGNYWTTNNISITAGVTYDSMTDVPTLTSATTANYAVLNPLATLGSVSISYSNGNLNWSSSQGTGISTIGLTTGKFYAEVVATSISASNFECGLITEPYLITAGYRSNGTKDVDSGSNNSSYGASYVANDVIGIAVDVDAKSITFYKNNTSQGSFTFTNNGPYFFASIDRGPNASTGFWNFGQRPFVYTPPTGFNRLNTFNLPTPTIGASASTLANNNFNAVLYAGNSATQAIGGLNFQPDLVWTKSRSSNSTNHLLTDVSRGVTNSLMSNNDTVQGTRGVSSFNSNGFTYIAPNEGGDGNVSGQNYVGWCWKANGAPVTNTAGSITSQVSANTSAGFSIVRHVNTGSAATIGHGLGVAPRFIINRVYDRAENWRTYFGVANQYLILNGTNSAITDTSIWNNTQPTSSVFSIGAYFSSGDDIISYCFTPIANYSAIGTYTGNGSTDGPFVFTGFRPRFVMIKNITTGSTNWFIYDAARNTFNLTNAVLLPSNSTAELTSDGGGAFGFDFVSNGFKIRTSRGDNNNNADTFIYAAFAESPFKYANAR